MKKYIKRVYFSVITIPYLLCIGVAGIWELWRTGSCDDLDWDFWS